MKKILFCLIIFCIFATNGWGQTSVRVYPKTSFVGITKSTDTYNKQSIDKDPKTFFIGYDQSKNMWGRGYLEFDISQIPANAKIESATLQLTSKIDFSSNFNGKIQIYQCQPVSDANETLFYILKGSGEPALSPILNKEGDGISITSEFFKAIVRDRRGMNMYLSINHVDESKKIKLGGSQNELYIDIVYKLEDTTNPPTHVTYEKKINILGPTKLNINSIVEFRVELKDFYTMTVPKWIIDEKYFEIESTRREENIHIIKLRTKNIPTKNTFIKYRGYYSTWTSTTYYNGYLETSITPSFTVRDDKEFIVCKDNDVMFSIGDITSDVSVYWETGHKMNLVSGQGTPNAIFTGLLDGRESIKATITYDGQEYILNHNKIWIGVPDRGTNVIDTKPNDYFSSIKIGYHDDYVESHEWLNLPSLYTSQRRNATMYIASKHIINAGGLNLAVDRTNKCGTTRFYWNLTVNGKSGEPPREKSIIKTDIENISSPVSIRVFSFTTGLVLYQKKNVIDFNIQNTSLKEGIYIVETTDAAGKVTTEKVQKNRQ
ncbi:hypothetical protein [Dysgonomonas sp. BGC7]|uniref:hypothetical protein n=1 Tax=Dysgonomonas sp. BGC7 TaxID=1658008 RepID=UPI0012FB82EC|nr:hypothetical protein [Dysgonomonas sp. BGC7]MBD8388220.1 hypothetical protein [Dysgonomonas sp. BGC7]